MKRRKFSLSWVAGKCTRLYALFRKQTPAVLVGLSITAVLALLAWLLAYFGYISLGLPRRFDFQILNHTIQATLPNDYAYSVQNIPNFRGPNTNTILVIGHSKQFDRNQSIFKGSDQALSDEVIFLDQTTGGYKVSYKFQPLVRADSDALLANVYGIRLNYINQEGKNTILIGWAHIGVSASPPIPMLFSDQAGAIKVSTLDASRPPWNDKQQNGVELTNRFDPLLTLRETAIDNYFASSQGVAFTVLTNLVCKACSDNSYQLLYFNVGADGFTYRGVEPKEIHGTEELKSVLLKSGYEYPYRY